jgi:mannose-1-phosphate guanylyltransferase
MKVILLAAGFGSRLKPLTEKTPKCLIPIGGKPLLEIWLEKLLNAGLGPILINTHYLHTQVEEFIKKSPYSKHVLLSHETQLLGTAGTLKENIDFFENKDGMILHADNYCLENLHDFIDAHYSRPTECDITMLTFRTNEPESCGIVEINNKNIVTSFHEKSKSPPGNLANGAIYILSSKFIRNYKIQFLGAKDLSIDVIAKSVGSVYSYESEKILIDIGNPNSYMQANQKASFNSTDIK